MWQAAASREIKSEEPFSRATVRLVESHRLLPGYRLLPSIAYACAIAGRCPAARHLNIRCLSFSKPRAFEGLSLCEPFGIVLFTHLLRRGIGVDSIHK